VNASSPQPSELKAAALSFAKRHGFDGDVLPSGIQWSSTHCPLARALGAQVGCGKMFKDRSGVRLPELVEAFRIAFDSGRFPELIDSGAREGWHA
jgi:hypothetical protein